eukprot:CAMPEP_0117695028 /NCGR_PEP_ID=MMETSP0804-20121206/27865_1 /TAXON_ID=1074897 /ORGANISM="Tetraselmis astigmatica, Strain CCMP880" /LENGTH=397 /DNA_ID=CAMNT_0005508961 /DNA_START=131 /DNA_END=1325 /DNA_ORIENTATION=+
MCIPAVGTSGRAGQQEGSDIKGCKSSPAAMHVGVRQRSMAARASPSEDGKQPSDSRGIERQSLPGPVGSAYPTNQLLLHLMHSEQEFLVQGAAEQRLEQLAEQVDSLRKRTVGDAADADPINQVLYARMAEVQMKEIRREAVCILYLCCAAKLQAAGVPLCGLHSSETHATNLLGPVCTDGIIGHLDGILGQAGANPNTMARVAADQIAGLYLGTMEMAYFLHRIKSRMAQEGRQVSGSNCGALLDYAESLPIAVIRSATEMATEEAAQIAREHTAKLFGLQPEEPDGGLGPRHPQLQAMSGVQIAPTAYLLENFDNGGRAEDLQAKASSKASRGWSNAAQRDMEEAGAVLPSPNIIETTFGQLRLLMLEAAALGHTLWEMEGQLNETFRFQQRVLE